MLKFQINHHFEEALNHFNNALDEIENGEPEVHICRTLFDAFNKLQTAWLNSPEQAQRDPARETKNFIDMIVVKFPEELRDELTKREELVDFVNLEPSVMDQQTLKMKNYDPHNISSTLRKVASDKHNSLKNAYNAYLKNQTPELQLKIITKMADVLYTVRSNIAHGEKTPRGPDFDKIKRDAIVSKTAIPLLMYLFKNIIGEPDSHYIAYGTLSPGGVNHSILSDIAGTWTKCTISGEIQFINNLPVFSQSKKNSITNANVLESQDLPSCWNKIDEFEGFSYKRRLISAFGEDGNSIVGYIYVSTTNPF